MDEEAIGELLEALSDAGQQKKASKQYSCLRGIRGTPLGEVARIAAAAWEDGVRLPEDEDALTRLFSTAWEDGLVAIGLLAALAPDHPEDALEIGREWLERVDDLYTADALGWLVLGPASLATGAGLVPRGRMEMRRSVAATGLAFLPIRIEGPSAAPLRARMNTKAVRFVEKPVNDRIEKVLAAGLRDEAPPVRKLLRRIVREWSKADPSAVVAWADPIRGGLPKLLQDEVKKARRRA